MENIISTVSKRSQSHELITYSDTKTSAMINIGTTALIVGLVLIGEYMLAKWVGRKLRKKNRNRTRARIVYMNSFPKENDYPVEAYEAF